LNELVYTVMNRLQTLNELPVVFAYTVEFRVRLSPELDKLQPPTANKTVRLYEK
jgi:hypothetical protein